MILAKRRSLARRLQSAFSLDRTVALKLQVRSSRPEHLYFGYSRCMCVEMEQHDKSQGWEVARFSGEVKKLAMLPSMRQGACSTYVACTEATWQPACQYPHPRFHCRKTHIDSKSVS